jgi:hypothetical protein
MFHHVDCCEHQRRASPAPSLTSCILAVGVILSSCGGSPALRSTPSGNGSPQGRLVVDSLPDLTVGGPRGGPFFPQEGSCRLKNDGDRSLYWTPDTNLDWLRATPTAGQLAPKQSVEVRVHIDPDRAAALEPGLHRGELRFLDRSRGRCAASVDVDLWIGVVLEEGTWLRVQAKKELPIFVWNEIPTSTWIAYWRGLGIDTYLGSLGAGVTDPELLDLLHEQDMYGVLPFDALSHDHPALLAWTIEESEDPRVRSAESIREECLAIRKLDPSHPTVADLMQPRTGSRSRALDVPEGLLDLRGRRVSEPRTGASSAAASDPGTPTRGSRPNAAWSLIALDESEAARLGVSTETWLRHLVWRELVRGATGIGYATHLESPDALPSISSALESELPRTNAAVRELTDVLCSMPPAVQIEVGGEGANVSWMLRASNDSTWLFVVHDALDPRGADVRFTFDKTILSVENWFEESALPSSDKGFSDHLGPLDVRIYRMRLERR